MTETPPKTDAASRRWIGRIISIAAVASALFLGIIVARRNISHPSTDDATARANVVGIAPRVSGLIVEIEVADNQTVKQGDVLYRVDQRPYELALERALASKQRIARQIDTTQRRIEAERSAVEAAGSQVAKAVAQLEQASSTLARLEPLLGKKFVTEEQVEQARTAKRAAEAGLAQAKAEQARATNLVDDLGVLEAQLKEADVAIGNARLDLDSCVVVAPFPARVVNLNISKGTFANAGTPVLTLIDVRNWYVIGNFRETDLANIQIGAPATVFLMEQPRRRFRGTVQGIGSGVVPEDGSQLTGLPNIQRTLNWVRLAQRFPVRIRLDVEADDQTLRVGASAVVEIGR
jgi:multidrug efflux system membrane fusion protein